MKRETHIINASDKILGRLATKIAILLQGKNKPDFLPYKDMGDIVIVKNVDKIRFSGKKLKQGKYFYHTDYPGGLKEVAIKNVFEKNPGKLLKKAVLGMLPKNKLRTKRIKRLKFK